MGKQNWIQLASIQAGGAICLPIFLIGFTLAKSYGVSSAYLAIAIGNCVLLCLALINAWKSSKTRKTTAEYAIDVFGENGKIFFAGAMVFSMIGWFAIQTNVIGITLAEYTPISSTFLNIIIGLGITLSALTGIKGLSRVANFSIPLMLATIGYAIYEASSINPIELPNEHLNFSGVSIIIACAIASVIDLPTFFRQARSQKDSMIAAVLMFGLILPLLESVGVYLFYHSPGNNIIQLLTGTNPSILWGAWIASFLLLAGWTTNNKNIYSASVNLKVILPKVSLKIRTILVGIAGTALACMNIEDNMETILGILGILLSSMGAVMIISFLKKDESRNHNVMIWIFGIAVGFLNIITHIAVVDAFLGAAALKLIEGGLSYERAKV